MKYSWHESLRRLARGVSSLHQHQNTEEEEKKKKKNERGGKKEGEKRGEKGRQTHTLDMDN